LGIDPSDDLILCSRKDRVAAIRVGRVGKAEVRAYTRNLVAGFLNVKGFVGISIGDGACGSVDGDLTDRQPLSVK
jgi:hypothetical protein